MEERMGFVLRHKETGLYYDRMAEHTTKLWSAWRFIDEQQLQTWMQVAMYAPAHPDEYEPIKVKLTIDLED